MLKWFIWACKITCPCVCLCFNCETVLFNNKQLYIWNQNGLLYSEQGSRMPLCVKQVPYFTMNSLYIVMNCLKSVFVSFNSIFNCLSWFCHEHLTNKQVYVKFSLVEKIKFDGILLLPFFGFISILYAEGHLSHR